MYDVIFVQQQHIWYSTGGIHLVTPPGSRKLFFYLHIPEWFITLIGKTLRALLLRICQWWSEHRTETTSTGLCTWKRQQIITKYVQQQGGRDCIFGTTIVSGVTLILGDLWIIKFNIHWVYRSCLCLCVPLSNISDVGGPQRFTCHYGSRLGITKFAAISIQLTCRRHRGFVVR